MNNFGITPHPTSFSQKLRPSLQARSHDGSRRQAKSKHSFMKGVGTKKEYRSVSMKISSKEGSEGLITRNNEIRNLVRMSAKGILSSLIYRAQQGSISPNLNGNPMFFAQGTSFNVSQITRVLCHMLNVNFALFHL